MPKHDYCIWCWKPVKLPDTYDPKLHKPVCSWPCYYAELYFSAYNSDDEKTMRSYWTKGG